MSVCQVLDFVAPKNRVCFRKILYQNDLFLELNFIDYVTFGPRIHRIVAYFSACKPAYLFRHLKILLISFQNKQNMNLKFKQCARKKGYSELKSYGTFEKRAPGLNTERETSEKDPRTRFLTHAVQGRMRHHKFISLYSKK